VFFGYAKEDIRTYTGPSLVKQEGHKIEIMDEL
jgi:hypothetical protein